MSVTWQPGRTLEEVEKDVIFAALKFFRNNKVHTAKALGICYKTLNNKLEEYNGTTSLQTSGRSDVQPAAEDTQKQSVPVQERQKVQELSPAIVTESSPDTEVPAANGSTRKSKGK